MHIKGFHKELLRLLIIAALVLPATGMDVAKADPSWYDSSWQYRKKITIDHTKVVADLTDFPLLISLASDSDLASSAQSSGDDILFTASDEVTKLNHEIENFDGTTGELVAWVKIPSLSASADTDIYMYYGNDSATSQQNPIGVWDSSYVMVQHLEESSGQHLDSTSNDIDSTSVTVTQQGADIGQIAGADEFNGSGDYVGLSGTGTLSNNTYSVSAWIKADNPSPRQNVVWGAISGSSDVRIMLQVYDTWVNFMDNYGVDAYYPIPGTIQAATWYYYVGTYDYPNQEASIYLDGQYKASDTSFSQAPSTALGNLRIGHGPPGWWAHYFDGIIDEVRISDTVRSADWIETEYNNQRYPDKAVYGSDGFFSLSS